MSSLSPNAPKTDATLLGIIDRSGVDTMPRKKIEDPTSFGARLAAFRKAAGYTQVELAEELGVSQRMMAYYESPQANPPATLLPAIAKALGVTTDELLGATPISKRTKPTSSRLQRRLQQLEKLDPRKKRQLLQLLDTFIESDRFRRKVGS